MKKFAEYAEPTVVGVVAESVRITLAISGELELSEGVVRNVKVFDTAETPE